jgi:hypothetical protein
MLRVYVFPSELSYGKADLQVGTVAQLDSANNLVVLHCSSLGFLWSDCAPDMVMWSPCHHRIVPRNDEPGRSLIGDILNLLGIFIEDP